LQFFKDGNGFIDGSVNSEILTSGNVQRAGLLPAAVCSFVQSKTCMLVRQCYLFWSDKGKLCMCKHLLSGCTKCKAQHLMGRSEEVAAVDCTLIQSLCVLHVPWAKTSGLVEYCA
jgi:hypothetical protein